jgi:hypothetical protein
MVGVGGGYRPGPMRGAWVAVVLTLAVLPACGGDDGGGADDEVVPTAEWAATVCGEVQDAVGELADALAVIDQLPEDVEVDAPLGEHADAVKAAFLALPEYVDRYRAVVDDTPAPDTDDGIAFRHEVLDDLEAAAATFQEAADAAETLDEDTTVEDFFGGAQAFNGFPQAFAASDLDFGEDVPPGVASALLDDQTCIDTQNQLLALIG